MSLSIRSCINCGSWSVQKNYFCSSCSNLLIDKMKAHNPIQLRSFVVNPLFMWRPGQSDSLSSLILDLKSAPAASWNYYAQRFLEQQREFSKRSLLVSSISKSGNKHAQNWAECLSRITGIPHVVGLKLLDSCAESTSQKDLTKLARRARVFEKIADIPIEKLDLIFVDDVVTTGATALAAYRALGTPRNFQVWCLASRELTSIASH